MAPVLAGIAAIPAFHWGQEETCLPLALRPLCFSRHRASPFRHFNSAQLNGAASNTMAASIPDEFVCPISGDVMQVSSEGICNSVLEVGQQQRQEARIGLCNSREIEAMRQFAGFGASQDPVWLSSGIAVDRQYADYYLQVGSSMSGHTSRHGARDSPRCLPLP